MYFLEMSKIGRKRTRDESEASGSDTPKVGSIYIVEREGFKGAASIIDATWISDDLIADEQLAREKGETTGLVPGSEKLTTENNSTKAGKMMFYVHYEGTDRRNDEWVTRDRIFRQVDLGEVVIPEITSGGNEAIPLRGGALTRSQRRIHEEFNHLKQSYQTMDPATARLEKEHEERTKVKNIPKVIIGKYCMNTWYYSPFPNECNLHDLYFCEYCLLYSSSKKSVQHHYQNCEARQPPGNEIYRKDHLSVYEVDGSNEKLYCQCLCLLSKLFMDHKTLYFDVDDFIFYILCEVDNEGAHIVGYFSREVESANNLACIMVFPPFQDRGYGKLLIQLSYEISSREGYIGTPEKPLSDLGKVSYRSYWWYLLIGVLQEHSGNSILATELSHGTGIAVDDIVNTLSTLRMDATFAFFVDGDYVIRSSKRVLDFCLKNNYGKPPRILLDKSAVRWRPQITRSEDISFSVKQNHRRPSNTPLATPPITMRSNSREELGFDSSPNLSETSRVEDFQE